MRDGGRCSACREADLRGLSARVRVGAASGDTMALPGRSKKATAAEALQWLSRNHQQERLVTFDDGDVFGHDAKDVLALDVHAGDGADAAVGLSLFDGAVADSDETQVGHGLSGACARTRTGTGRDGASRVGVQSAHRTGRITGNQRQRKSGESKNIFHVDQWGLRAHPNR